MSHVFGARPPAGRGWQQGKTAASIQFVQEAEALLSGANDVTADERKLLEAQIDMLKNGAVSLDDFEAVNAWLERLRDHHP